MCIGILKHRAEVRSLEVFVITYTVFNFESVDYTYLYFYGEEEGARKFAKKFTIPFGEYNYFADSFTIEKRMVDVLVPIKERSGDMDWDNAVVIDGDNKLMDKDD